MMRKRTISKWKKILMETWTQIQNLKIQITNLLMRMMKMTKLTTCWITIFGIKICRTWKSKRKKTNKKKIESKISVKETFKMKTLWTSSVIWLKVIMKKMKKNRKKLKSKIVIRKWHLMMSNKMKGKDKVQRKKTRISVLITILCLLNPTNHSLNHLCLQKKRKK